jgi:hypothetical protein
MFEFRQPVNPLSRRLREQIGSHSVMYATPHYIKLLEYERMRNQDVAIKAALDLTANIAVGYIGAVGHPDRKVDEWMQENLHFLEWEQGTTFLELFHDWFITSLWAGFSVAENMFVLGEDGRVWLSDVMTYHPRSIRICPDKKGRLVDGQPTYMGMITSGFWQDTREGPKKIPMWKVSWLAHQQEFGNYYGRSYLESVYRWHLIADMIGDMMVDAMDRFGSPWVVIKFPNGLSNQKVVDPATGLERQMTIQEALEHQVEEVKVGGRNVMLMGYNDPQMKPDVDVITTGNNFGKTFIEVLNFCDAKKMQSFMVPFGLIDYNTTQRSANLERQAELFFRGVRVKAEQAMRSFLGQTFHRLIQINFPGVKEPPTLTLRDLVRPEDRVALMQMVTGLSKHGYLNPTDEDDWQMVRDWVAATKRRMHKADTQFIKDTVISPLQNKSSGEGTQPRRGRPVGTSRPQDEPRAEP